MKRHLHDLVQSFIREQIAIGERMHDDMCRACADDVGTPFPVGSTGIYHGLCNWCGRSDVPLMPVVDLEETGFEEVQAYV